MYKLIATLLLISPSLRNYVMRSAYSKPYFHLHGYMYRWWVTPRFLLTEDENGNLCPYSWVPKVLRCRLHHIVREDAGRSLHNHPCDNVSIVLSGWYSEKSLSSESSTRGMLDEYMYDVALPFQVVKRNAKDYHSIVDVSNDGVFSLWFMGKKVNEWGFLVGGEHIDHKNYFIGVDNA